MKLRKVLAMVLTVVLAGSFMACGGNSSPDAPDKETLQEDVQEYITQVVNDAAEITYFSVDESGVKDDSFTADCIATYQDDTTKYVDMFQLTYKVKDGDWEMDKISIDTSYDGRAETPLEEDGENTKDDEKKDASAGDKDNTSKVTMSDELKDFTFTLDGVVYQLPFSYSDLTANGWTISSTGTYETDQISANSYEYVTMAKSGNRIDVDVINLSGNAKALSECKVGGIDVDMSSISDASFFSIAKDINLMSTQEEITKAFGSPNTTNDADDYTNLQYDFGDYMNVQFLCYKTDTKYNQISLKNYASDESDVTETSEEIPEYLAEYKAPAELGSDPFTGNIELAGKVYALPAPVSEFTAAGWKITSKPDSVGSGRMENIRIEKDGMQIYVDVMNFASYQTIPENCAVCGIDVYEDDTVPMKLPGGISMDSKKADIEAWKTDEFSYNKSSTNYTYSFDDYDTDFSIWINVNVETETIYSISVSAKQWNK